MLSILPGPRSCALGSSASPPAVATPNGRAESAGSNPRGAGRPPAWATRAGVCAPTPDACAVSVGPAAAAVVETMKFRRVTSISKPLARGAAHGRGLAREAEPLAGVRHLRAVHLQNRHVAIGVVAHVEILAVGAEDDALRQATHLDLADLRHLLAVDLQHADPARLVGKPGVLRHAGAPVQVDRAGDLARRPA